LSVQADETEAAGKILGRLITHPGHVNLAVCAVTPGEYANNLSNTLTAARNELLSMHAVLIRAHTVAGHVKAASPVTSIPTNTNWIDALLSASKQLADRVLRQAELLPMRDEETKAHGRVGTRTPPAHRGSESFYDCLVTECALTLARSRPAGSTHFISSNKKDFFPIGRQLDPVLQREFADAGLEFSKNWATVAQRLRL
jgi:hypothetical protein